MGLWLAGHHSQVLEGLHRMLSLIRRCAPVALVTVALAVPSSAAADPVAVASKACEVGNSRSYGTTYVLSISARNISCTRARRVVRAFHECRPGRRGRCARFNGWSCSENRFNRSSGSYDSRVRCARGSRVVRHTYTQFV
jgi:hypothetical protein